jgi:hypothetical protein
VSPTPDRVAGPRPAASAAGAQDPFAELAALARAEHALVLDERFDELEALGDRRVELVAALPAQTPPHAMSHVREAARLQGLITAALAEARDRMAVELGRLDRTREGVQGYAGGTPTHFRVIDAAG